MKPLSPLPFRLPVNHRRANGVTVNNDMKIFKTILLIESLGIAFAAPASASDWDDFVTHNLAVCRVTHMLPRHLDVECQKNVSVELGRRPRRLPPGLPPGLPP